MPDAINIPFATSLVLSTSIEIKPTINARKVNSKLMRPNEAKSNSLGLNATKKASTSTIPIVIIIVVVVFFMH